MTSQKEILEKIFLALYALFTKADLDDALETFADFYGCSDVKVFRFKEDYLLEQVSTTTTDDKCKVIDISDWGSDFFDVIKKGAPKDEDECLDDLIKLKAEIGCNPECHMIVRPIPTSREVPPTIGKTEDHLQDILGILICIRDKDKFVREEHYFADIFSNILAFYFRSIDFEDIWVRVPKLSWIRYYEIAKKLKAEGEFYKFKTTLSKGIEKAIKERNWDEMVMLFHLAHEFVKENPERKQFTEPLVEYVNSIVETYLAQLKDQRQPPEQLGLVTSKIIENLFSEGKGQELSVIGKKVLKLAEEINLLNSQKFENGIIDDSSLLSYSEQQPRIGVKTDDKGKQGQE